VTGCAAAASAAAREAVRQETAGVEARVPRAANVAEVEARVPRAANVAWVAVCPGAATEGRDCHPRLCRACKNLAEEKNHW